MQPPVEGGRGVEMKVRLEWLGMEVGWPSGPETRTDADGEALVMVKGVVALKPMQDGSVIVVALPDGLTEV